MRIAALPSTYSKRPRDRPSYTRVRAEGCYAYQVDGTFAGNCLLARRLAERGVRFIQLYHRDWDHHGGLKPGSELKAEEVDRACAHLFDAKAGRRL